VANYTDIENAHRQQSRAQRDREVSAERRLRVAYIVHTFDMGGLERCISRLANHLDRAKFEPVIICLDRGGDASRWLEVDDVPVVELRKRPGNDPGVVKRLANELKRRDIQIMHSHNWGTLLEATLARKFSGTPVHVHAERGMEFSDQHKSGLRAWLRYRASCWALNRANAIVAVADVVRERLKSHCGKLRPEIFVVPNGVDVPPGAEQDESRSSILNRCGIPGDAFVLGSVGRLAAVKDFGVAIEAVALLQRRGCEAHLVLVGEGPERKRLADLANQHSCATRIHLVGQQADIGTWYRAMDVYLNVSQSEGMSQAILEAMSLGRPMVVTDVGANRALTGGDGACGLIVPPRNPAALEEAVTRLANDRAYRRQLSENGLERYQSLYSVNKMIQAYERLYSRLAQAGASHK